jgi:hypothetical protein
MEHKWTLVPLAKVCQTFQKVTHLNTIPMKLNLALTFLGKKINWFENDFLIWKLGLFNYYFFEVI